MFNTLKKLLITLPAKIVIGLTTFYLLFSYFAINPLAKKIVPWIAETQLASEASVGKVSFDPLRLKLTVDALSLQEMNHAPLASAAQIVVDLEASGIFDLAWKFKEINLVKPKGLISISPKGTLNWDALIAKLNEDPSPPDDTIPRLVIERILVKQGDLRYVDNHRPSPFKAELSPLNFELAGFSTLPKDRGDYLIAAKFAENGGALKWKGNMGVNPVVSKGSIAMDGVQLHKIMRIVKGTQLPFKANSGAIHVDVDYDFSLPQDKPKLVLSRINLLVKQLNAMVDDVGELSADAVHIAAPHLDLSMHPHLTIALQQPNVALDALSLRPNRASTITLDKLDASIPLLHLNQQAETQLAFEQLNMRLSNLNIAHQQKSLLHVPDITVENGAFDLKKSHASIAQIALNNGSVSANRNPSGQLNWLSAFDTPQATTASASVVETSAQKDSSDKTAKPFIVDIANVLLKQWKLAAKDQSFTHPLQLTIADIDVDFAVNKPKEDWEIHGLQTKLSQLTLQSSLSTKPVAHIQHIELKQGDLLLEPQQVNVQSILISGIKTELIRAPDATLNWQSILASTAGTSTQKGAKHGSKSSEADWKLALKQLEVTNSQLHIEEQSAASPVVLDLQKIALEARDASLDLTRAIPLKAGFSIQQGGRFEAKGKLAPAPLMADMQIQLTGASFKPFAPYINQFALLKLNDGSANLNGKLLVKAQDALKLNFNGGFSIDKLALVEEANNAPFLAWEQMKSDTLEFSLAPNRLHMATLNLRQPVGKFIINPDKSTNIARILRTQSADVASASPSTVIAPNPDKPAVASTSNDLAKPARPVPPSNTVTTSAPIVEESGGSTEAFPISIESMRIENGALEFADLSLTPQFGTAMHDLSGVMNGIGTDANATAQVELDGKVDEYGAARVRGSVKPFKATQFTDLKLSFTNLEMRKLTPYSGKFAGRYIDSGKLSADLEYKIKQRQLAGENKFIINKLKLGDKVNSADAANLPLDLAIAILEDSDGIIDLDLPITGSLDDPKFSYGSIVWKAIRNILGKIITAPFRALGKLFGGDGDKLEAILFEAGSANLSPPEREKFITINKALSKRQGLALGIVPSFDRTLDARALQETAIRRQVLAEMGVELAPEQAPGPIDLSNPKAQKAVDSLHDTLTKKSLLKKLAAKFEKPPPGYFEAALEKLITSYEIKEADLQALAIARGKTIQKTLLDAGIATERVHIDQTVAASGDAKLNTVPTKLTIDVKAAAKQGDTKQDAPKPTAEPEKANP
jgi:Domain of Unknown Function (DUF748)